MDIEKVAHETPEAIITEPVDMSKGLQLEQARRVAEKIGFSGDQANTVRKNMAFL